VVNRWCVVFSRFAVLVLAAALVGCSGQSQAITLDVDLGPPPDEPTYYGDILPLAQKHCVSCHRPGGIAPFSMLTYDDAKAEALAISAEVGSGLMPPWLPASGCRPLQADRTLSPADAALFVRWGSGFALSGDAALAPPRGDGTAGLPSVDRSMKMAAAYTPPAGESDHYQCFILDPQLAADADLIGYDVHPGAAQEVHHVLLYPADAAEAQALDDATPGELGWTCFGGPGTTRTLTVGGWVPGSSATRFPANTGIQLLAGRVLVMQVHYNLTYADPTPDQTTVELELADMPVALHAQLLPILNDSFSVPPGARGYPVEASFRAPVNGTIWGTLPHAHTHATQMHVDSDAGCMVDIPAWDFHWQQQYFFTEPMAIAKGQKVRLTCTYDNPGALPLTWGESTSDEMCLDYLYVTP
jgi:hypothetical protein